ncbi:transposase [Streptomyces toxytricini]|uniref:Transposase n=1 Tax=Streptomyces toxytricini TaxID=67369 RepID=A0ABW8ES02_STRT5
MRVSERSAERWRRQWRERGKAGVLSKGSPGRPRLSEAQIARLERELERGPLVHGWADQRWTLARIRIVAASGVPSRGAVTRRRAAGQSPLSPSSAPVHSLGADGRSRPMLARLTPPRRR